MIQPPPVLRVRDYSGWIWLTLICLITFGLTFAPKQAGSEKLTDLSEVQETLKSALSRPAAAAGLDSKDKANADADSRTALLGLEKEIQPKHLADSLAATEYAVVRYQLKEPITEADLAPIKTGNRPLDKSVYTVYSSKNLTKLEAETLTADFDNLGFMGSVMRAQAFDKAGDPSQFQKLVNRSEASIKLLIGGSTIFLLLLAGVGATLISTLAQGRFRWAGFPAVLLTLLHADRFAVLAAMVLGLDFLSQVLAAILGAMGLNELGTNLLVTAAVACALAMLFKMTIAGGKISPAAVGLSTERFWRNVGIGLCGFVLEIPIAFLFAGLGATLFSGVKNPTHPVTVQLTNTHSLPTIAGIFLLAAVMAPVLEEIVFRGLLFPALSRLMGGVIWPAVITSFVFASIHPQGIALWLGLAWVGAASCMLVYYSKSLVPSIVMHAAHNSALLLLTILYS